MPTRNASAPRRSPGAKKEPLEIVVRRGAVRRFDALKTQTSDLPVVVTWDRRKADRRDSTALAHQMDVPRDRRAADRRQEPPFTWELADFVVVAPTSEQTTPRKKKKPKKP
jgi:hypothetical protein